MHNAYTVHNLHDCFTTWSCNMFHPRRHSCSLSLRAEMEPVLLHSVRRSQNAGDMRWHEVTQVLQQPIGETIDPMVTAAFLAKHSRPVAISKASLDFASELSPSKLMWVSTIRKSSRTLFAFLLSYFSNGLDPTLDKISEATWSKVFPWLGILAKSTSRG